MVTKKMQRRRMERKRKVCERLSWYWLKLASSKMVLFVGQERHQNSSCAVYLVPNNEPHPPEANCVNTGLAIMHEQTSGERNKQTSELSTELRTRNRRPTVMTSTNTRTRTAQHHSPGPDATNLNECYCRGGAPLAPPLPKMKPATSNQKTGNIDVFSFS